MVAALFGSGNRKRLGRGSEMERGLRKRDENFNFLDTAGGNTGTNHTHVDSQSRTDQTKGLDILVNRFSTERPRRENARSADFRNPIPGSPGLTNDHGPPVAHPSVSTHTRRQTSNNKLKTKK